MVEFSAKGTYMSKLWGRSKEGEKKKGEREILQMKVLNLELNKQRN